MTRNQEVHFELYVMDLAEECKCNTGKDFRELSEDLHEAVENALQDMCMDLGITDYDPPY